MNNNVKGTATEKLLLCISRRLSGRLDCKGVNYEVCIDENGVRITPNFHVFPSVHKRSMSDRTDIVSWVHFTQCSKYTLDDFVFGRYVYQSTYDNKRRRWRRIS